MNMNVSMSKTSAENMSSHPQHSGIRAVLGKMNKIEIKPSSTLLPCQHCTDEAREKIKRNHREKTCYYCRQPRHKIHACKRKETDEATQLIRQTVNEGIQRQEGEVNNHQEMVVVGTEGGLWNEIWYVSSVFKHHIAGNLNVFKRIKHIIGVDTRTGEHNFLFTKGVGSIEIKTGNENMRIQSVFYSPELDRNVLSLDQLTLQGFTTDWSIMIVNAMEFKEFEDCRAFMNLFDDRDFVLKYKHILDSKFEELVKWFLFDYMGIKTRPVPPIDSYMRKINLLSLYLLVAMDGGYQNVTTENIWPAIAKDMGFNYEDGDYMRVTYAAYLDVLEYYYNFKQVQHNMQDKKTVLEEGTVKTRPVPPIDLYMRKINLLSLYLLVAMDGGFQNVTTENIWPAIAKDLGFNYEDGDYMRVTYAAYLDVLEYYYDFKQVQQNMQDKKTVLEEGTSTSVHQESSKNTGVTKQNAVEMEPVALFAGVDDEDWNKVKRRKRFNFNYAKWAMDEANRSVLDQARKHNLV
ncbi:putative transcription factor interactor and regulator CCHC(Zn) family [Helianthus debilis subsp. tardiflorus]